jgi:hypothetical protein
MNPRDPHSQNWYLGPLGQRPNWQRRTVANWRNAPVGAQVPGTAAFGREAGAPPVEGPEDKDPAPVPEAYTWDGTGAVPDDLWALGVALAVMLGTKESEIPPKTDSAAWSQFLPTLYSGLGEGCAINYNRLTHIIADNAANGPVAVAYGIQTFIEKYRQNLCAKYIVNRISAPDYNAPAEGAITVSTTNGKKTTPAMPTWGWVLGGVGVLGLVGVAVYFATRKKKRRNPPAPLVVEETRENPCACGNPTVSSAPYIIQNPYGGQLGFPGVDPGLLELDSEISMPLVQNPRRRGGGRKSPKGGTPRQAGRRRP